MPLPNPMSTIPVVLGIVEATAKLRSQRTPWVFQIKTINVAKMRQISHTREWKGALPTHFFTLSLFRKSWLATSMPRLVLFWNLISTQRKREVNRATYLQNKSNSRESLCHMWRGGEVGRRRRRQAKGHYYSIFKNICAAFIRPCCSEHTMGDSQI